MTLKTSEKQALIAEFKESLGLAFLGYEGGQFARVKPRDWVCEVVDNVPVFYKVVDKTRQIVEHWRTEDVIVELHQMAIQAAETELRYVVLGAEALLTRRQIANILDYICARIVHEDIPQKVKIWPIADVTANEPGTYYLHRLPYPFFTEWDKKDIERGNDSNFGEFIDSLKAHFLSPEMFDILCCFVARVVMEDRYSEEFLFWYGEGGDGKGTLMSYFIDFLGRQAAIVQPGDFDSRFGAASYAHLRLAVVDEFSRKFDLWSSRVKTLTGMGTIPVEKKGKDIFYVRNRLTMIFLANDRPKFQNVSSQSRRLRYIESLPRKFAGKKDRQELKKELDTCFPAFLRYACALYVIKYDRRIPETNPDILEELAESRIEPVYNFVVSNFDYAPGCFVSKAAIDKLWPNRFPSSALDDAFELFAKQQGDGATVPKCRRRMRGAYLRGWNNVTIKVGTFGVTEVMDLIVEPQ